MVDYDYVKWCETATDIDQQNAKKKPCHLGDTVSKSYFLLIISSLYSLPGIAPVPLPLKAPGVAEL